MSDVFIYSSGFICCSVCAPADMPIEDVIQAVNTQNPTGISSDWQLSQDETFAGGQPNPCPCEQDNSRVHYLFNC